MDVFWLIINIMNNLIIREARLLFE